MKKVMLACIGALLLCSACLSARDLECWYDDMCKDFAGRTSQPMEAAPLPGAHIPVAGR